MAREAERGGEEVLLLTYDALGKGGEGRGCGMTCVNSPCGWPVSIDSKNRFCEWPLWMTCVDSLCG